MGYLGADPIQRETKNGKSVVNFSMATSRRYKTQISSESSVENPSAENTQDEFHQDTQWHQITVWGRRGQVCNQYLKKGHPVYVEGYLQTQKYEDKEGQLRTSVKIIAEEISFLASKTMESARTSRLQAQTSESA